MFFPKYISMPGIFYNFVEKIPNNINFVNCFICTNRSKTFWKVVEDMEEIISRA